jgi:Rha family phage regulatory protein
VLRDYDKLKCSDESGRLNYEPTEYIDEQGKICRLVTMTKDGFTMQAMGFTGPQAMAFKEKYIATFNAMATSLAAREQRQRG